MNAAVRIAASPYARRLARESGIALGAIAGSGPNGRVTATDVLARRVAAEAPAQPAADLAIVSAAAAAPAPVPAVASVRQTGAFAASIGLQALRTLIEAAGVAVPLEAFLAKAAASAADVDAVGLAKPGGGNLRIDGAARLAPSAIADAMASAEEGSAPLQLSVIRQSGIRPVAAALPEASRIRILVSVGEGPLAEAMLVHDVGAISESRAAAILAAFRDAIENPLRLLV